MSLILCITPNPAVDRSLAVAGFQASGVFRAGYVLVTAAGKGMNVARAIQTLGGNAAAAGFIGGDTGVLFEKLAREAGIPGRWTQIAGETRVCIIISDPDTGATTVINEPGPAVTPDEWARFQQDVLESARQAEVVSISGSLPVNSPLWVYTQLLRALRQAGKAVWIDASGDTLRAALDVPGVHVKVNHHEAGAIAGKTPAGPESAAESAAAIRQKTGGMVVVTMGKTGAVLVDGTARLFAAAPTVHVISNVGSGDSFLGGLLMGLTDSPQIALRQAVAAGTANTLTYGAARFTLDDYRRILDQVQVENLS